MNEKNIKIQKPLFIKKTIKTQNITLRNRRKFRK